MNLTSSFFQRNDMFNNFIINRELNLKVLVVLNTDLLQLEFGRVQSIAQDFERADIVRAATLLARDGHVLNLRAVQGCNDCRDDTRLHVVLCLFLELTAVQ